ncbi:MAG: hypothetical protein HKM04_06425 [Legionellales bacterium]|nr:hypothetical protein [Legionellales bacterium]
MHNKKQETKKSQKNQLNTPAEKNSLPTANSVLSDEEEALKRQDAEFVENMRRGGATRENMEKIEKEAARRLKIQNNQKKQKAKEAKEANEKKDKMKRFHDDLDRFHHSIEASIRFELILQTPISDIKNMEKMLDNLRNDLEKKANNKSLKKASENNARHCEERNDEAIQ